MTHTPPPLDPAALDAAAKAYDEHYPVHKHALEAAITAYLAALPHEGEVEAALTRADGCFEAALVEGWIEALNEGDIERIRDLAYRRVWFARAEIEDARAAIAAMRPARGDA